MQNVPLTKIKSYFEQNYNIRFIGDDNLFHSQLTLSFNKLNLEKALKRIFSRMNVALVFNAKGEVTEVRLMPTNHINTNMAALNNFAKYKEQGLQEQQSLNQIQENGLLEFDAQNTEMPGGSSLPVDDITNFQVVLNAEPPGDPLPVGQDNAPPDAFKVIRNSPPPGDMNITRMAFFKQFPAPLLNRNETHFRNVPPANT